MNIHTITYICITILFATKLCAQETKTDTSTHSLLPFKNSINTTTKDTSLTHNSINNTLNEWHRTRYQMGGNTKRGIDCSHFTAVVYKNTYGKILTGSARDYYANVDTTFTSPLELKAGDMVFFNINGRSLSHVGVYLGNNEFVHATVHLGVIKSNLNEHYYTKYYKGGGRFKNLITQYYTANKDTIDITEKLNNSKVNVPKKSRKATKKKTSKKKKTVKKKNRKKK
ncbi:MAG: C40 family peptidase [Bacteroidia bacterium]|nr:C40 family peptidase [Bacteroidia bacterium]